MIMSKNGYYKQGFKKTDENVCQKEYRKSRCKGK